MSGIAAVAEGRVAASSIECGLVSWLVKSGAHTSSSYPESRLSRIELRQLVISQRREQRSTVGKVNCRAPESVSLIIIIRTPFPNESALARRTKKSEGGQRLRTLRRHHPHVFLAPERRSAPPVDSLQLAVYRVAQSSHVFLPVCCFACCLGRCIRGSIVVGPFTCWRRCG
jgi:hypothetical protein